MKSKIHIIALTALVVIMTGCAGPEARHDNRVDRRHDTAERVEDRSHESPGQSLRSPRRPYDRRDARYGY
jgi:PBP1b-binding outer membrane lipoprotein LpoB